MKKRVRKKIVNRNKLLYWQTKAEWWHRQAVEAVRSCAELENEYNAALDLADRIIAALTPPGGIEIEQLPTKRVNITHEDGKVKIWE